MAGRLIAKNLAIRWRWLNGSPADILKKCSRRPVERNQKNVASRTSANTPNATIRFAKIRAAQGRPRFFGRWQAVIVCVVACVLGRRPSQDRHRSAGPNAVAYSNRGADAKSYLRARVQAGVDLVVCADRNSQPLPPIRIIHRPDKNPLLLQLLVERTVAGRCGVLRPNKIGLRRDHGESRALSSRR